MKGIFLSEMTQNLIYKRYISFSPDAEINSWKVYFFLTWGRIQFIKVVKGIYYFLTWQNSIYKSVPRRLFIPALQ